MASHLNWPRARQVSAFPSSNYLLRLRSGYPRAARSLHPGQFRLCGAYMPDPKRGSLPSGRRSAAQPGACYDVFFPPQRRPGAAPAPARAKAPQASHPPPPQDDED